MHGDAAAEAPREVRRDDAELLELPICEPAGEAAGDQQRLVLNRHTRVGELVDDPCDGRLPGVVLRRRNRKRRRFDHDRRAPAALHERLEGLADERETERVADRGADVGDCLAGLERP